MLRYTESGSAKSGSAELMVTGQGQTSVSSVETHLELLSPKSVPCGSSWHLFQLFGLNPACTVILKNIKSVCIVSFLC